MSEKGIWKNAVTMIGVAIGVALLSVVLSSLASIINVYDEGSQNSTAAVATPIELNIPAISAETIELAPLTAIVILAVIVVASVVIVGAGIAVLNSLISRQTTAVLESDTHKEYQSTISKRAKEQLKKDKQARPAAKAPDHTEPRWSVISTSLLILLFVGFFGMIVNFTLVPSGEYVLESGKLINSASRIVGVMLATTLLVLAIRIRAQRLADVAQTDNEGIPWNFIAVLTSGLIVVGLGIGTMVYYASGI